ncbi:MAG: LysR substrate-binding domain-containing protein [Halanaerobium sp.]
MKIEYLKSFYYTARCKSISKASKTLHITQPGLSKQLQKLEESFSMPLLQRSNKGVVLTEIGEKVFDYAETILHLEENLFNEIEMIKNKNKHLVIASCQNFGSFYFASKIHKFEENYNELRVKIDTFNSSEVLNKVLKHDYNLGILAGMENCDHLFFEKNCEQCPYIDKYDFFEDSLVLCASNEFEQDLITKRELKKIPIIMREKDSSAYNLINNFLAEINYKINELNVSLVSNSVNITKQSIINGSSLGFLPRSSIDLELERELIKIVDIETEHANLLDFEYSLIKRKNYQLNQHEKNFYDFILGI